MIDLPAFTLTHGDEVALTAMLEGRHTEPQMATVQAMYGLLNTRRKVREGLANDNATDEGMQA